MLLLGGDTGAFGAKRPDVQKNTDCRAARRIEKDVCRRAIRRAGDGTFGYWGFCAHSLWLEVICVRLRLLGEKDAEIDCIRSLKSGSLEISRYKFSRTIMKFGDYR